MGSPVMPEATNRLMATGGVIMPIAIPTTNTMPKCIRLMPIAFTSGKKLSRQEAEEIRRLIDAYEEECP